MPTPRIHPDETVRLATQTLRENRVAVMIVCYNAASHIDGMLQRIPDWVAGKLAEVFVIDDSSGDDTIQNASRAPWAEGGAPLKVFKTPYKQDYGGNQRLGYLYAINQGFDIVVLLHGDGQYAPEYLPEILAEYSRPGGADAVYGSRFIAPWDALKGGMPLYKFLGSRLLTGLLNRIIGTRLSEMHCGYRSYRTSALKKIPFQENSLGYEFDADIIIQFAAAGLTIREVPVPTYYGDEIQHVNGLQYAWDSFKSAVQYRLMRLEIFYNPRFDIPNRARKYTIKAAPTSLHHRIRHLAVPAGSELLDLGGGDGGAVALHHADQGVNVTVVDQFTQVDDAAGRRAATHPRLRHVAADLDGDWPALTADRRFDTVFVLDVLEHMKSPEHTTRQILSVLKPGGKLYASTGNISFWVIRGMHLLGHFNYGRRGILDLTHTRLFTTSSFQHLLRNAGFRIDAVTCFGPPVADLATRESTVLTIIDRASAWLAECWHGLFGYQILIEATRPDSLETLMSQTFLDHRAGSAVARKEPASVAISPERTAEPVAAWSKWLGLTGALLASVYILAAYSSFTRPIWIDEFLHFALGSHRSTAEAWISISDTLPTFNHGQTGIHMLVDYWLVHAFGANAFVLRLPSLLAGAFLLLSAVQIARHLRFNPAWILLLLAAFFCQQNLMYYVGEARPYFPLAATVMGVLAFYFVPVNQRTWFTRLCGGLAIVTGVLFHPFFPVYWLVLAIYTRALQPAAFNPRTWIKDFVRHCDPWLSVPAAITCLVLAKLTWLRGAPEFHMDPFQWIRNDGLFYTFTRITHFQFLGHAYLAAPIALGLGLLAALVAPVRRSAFFRRLAPPLALLAIAVGMSLLLSGISYYREYWVLPRQWVASMALCCIAVIWMAHEIATALSGKMRFLGLPVTVLMAYVLYPSVVPVYHMKSDEIHAVIQAVAHSAPPKSGAAPSIDQIPANNDEWVALANENIASGGPVWPIFRRYYARPD